MKKIVVENHRFIKLLSKIGSDLKEYPMVMENLILKNTKILNPSSTLSANMNRHSWKKILQRVPSDKEWGDVLVGFESKSK